MLLTERNNRLSPCADSELVPNVHDRIYLTGGALASVHVNGRALESRSVKSFRVT